MARACATLANWKAGAADSAARTGSCAWAALQAVQARTAPARRRVLTLFGGAGDVQPGRQLVRRRGRVALALERRRRLGALLRAAGTVGDVIDLERRHDRRPLEVQAVG